MAPAVQGAAWEQPCGQSGGVSRCAGGSGSGVDQSQPAVLLRALTRNYGAPAGGSGPVHRCTKLKRTSSRLACAEAVASSPSSCRRAGGLS